MSNNHDLGKYPSQLSGDPTKALFDATQASLSVRSFNFFEAVIPIDPDYYYSGPHQRYTSFSTEFSSQIVVLASKEVTFTGLGIDNVLDELPNLAGTFLGITEMAPVPGLAPVPLPIG